MEDKPIRELIEQIALECREAGATQWDIAKLVKELNALNIRSIEALREKAIELLEKMNPEAAKVYNSFYKLKVFTSSEEIMPFDRGNIIKSLLKETDSSRVIAEKIGHEVEDKIKDLKINFLSASLIRELTNAKLIEFNQENIRNQYTRIGMPVFDVQQKINSGFFENKEIMKEFTLLRVLPKEFIEMHFNKQLMIDFIHDFPTKFYSIKVIPQENDFIELFKKYFELQKISSKALCFNAINYAFASKNHKKIAKQLLNAFSALSECLYTVYLFNPNKKLFTTSNDSAINLAETLLEKSNKKIIVFDDYFKLKLLKEKTFSGNINLIQLKDQNNYAIDEKSFAEKNLLLALTLNLNAIAFKSENESKFFDLLQEFIETIKKLKELKLKELEKRSYLKGFQLEETQSILFVYSLFASTKFIAKEKNKNFAEKVLKTLKQELPEFLFFEAQDLKTIELMKKENEKVFGFTEKTEIFSSEFLNENYNFIVKTDNLKNARKLLSEKHSLIELTEIKP